MVLANKVAVIHGGGGAIGGAVARAFAAEGAFVHLAGRTKEKLEVVARAITAAGGKARVAVVDAQDEAAVARHVDAVVAEHGRIDIGLNAIGFHHVQGTPLAELSLADFERPIVDYTRVNFVTAKHLARPMVAQGSGVLLTLSTPAAKRVFPGVLGYGTTCAAIEGFSRLLAGELGAHGIRVVCLRADALPDAAAGGSSSRDVFRPVAAKAGLSVEEMLAGAAKAALLQRLPTLADVANAAVFLASDRAAAVTATALNLTCGSQPD